MPGGSLSPAALGQGVSPTSIGQSFATGMVTGQPAAAGAHSLSEGAMTAMQSGSVPPPQATPPITTPPVVSAPTMAAGIEATHGPVDTPANTPGAPPASTGTTGPVAPTVVTAGPVAAPAAPVVGGSAVPAGPLPAYNPPAGVDNKLGYGLVDPVAALTFNIPSGDRMAPGAQSRVITPAAPPPPPDHRARNIAIGFVGAVATGVLAMAIGARLRRAR